MFYLIKKLFLSFTRLSTWFHNPYHLLYYSQLPVFSFYTFFYSPISFSKKQSIETMLTFPIHTICKSSTTKWMKKEARSIRVSRTSFEMILPFDFCPVSKILICFSPIKRFLNDHERYSSHLQVSILHRVALIKFYLTIYESLKNRYLKKVFVS